MERKIAIGGAETGNEVVFKRADSSFCSVSAMNMRRDKLEIDALVGHVGLEGSGSLVVETLELRFEASGAEKGVCALVGGENFGPCFVFHGLDMYKVAVVLVDDEHVAVAVGGGLEEASGQVGEYLPGGGGEVGVDVTGAGGGRRGRRGMVVVAEVGGVGVGRVVGDWR